MRERPLDVSGVLGLQRQLHGVLRVADLRVGTQEQIGELRQRGLEVLLDDRDERPGVKFKDGDLIGIPLRITIGAKGLQKGSLELRWRRQGKSIDIPITGAAQTIYSHFSKSS